MKAPAAEFDVPAARRGWNGRIWPGHWLPCGPESMLKICLEWTVREAEFQGKNSASAL